MDDSPNINGYISKTQPVAATHGTVLPGWWFFHYDRYVKAMEMTRFLSGGSTSVPPHGTDGKQIGVVYNDGSQVDFGTLW